MNILWVVNTNTFLLILLIIMVSYLTAQVSALIRWLKREWHLCKGNNGIVVWWNGELPENRRNGSICKKTNTNEIIVVTVIASPKGAAISSLFQIASSLYSSQCTLFMSFVLVLCGSVDAVDFWLSSQIFHKRKMPLSYPFILTSPQGPPLNAN